MSIPVSSWRDIDAQEDLPALVESLNEHPDHAPLTFAYLNQLKMTGNSATPMKRLESGKG
ncbi:MAG: hypothetical protein M0Z56_03015 [Desulfobacteraceae bacterium]|nr:hypothetical protein [Desulfobacteraceae bacterium]